jgi:putative transposase
VPDGAALAKLRGGNWDKSALGFVTPRRFAVKLKDLVHRSGGLRNVLFRRRRPATARADFRTAMLLFLLDGQARQLSGRGCCDPRDFLHVKLESDPKEGPDGEAIEVYGRADHWGFARAGGGHSTADVCRKHGISSATFYGWKAKFGGLEVSDAKRLRQLEDENAKLKRLLADAMLDAAALKDLLSKKW